MICFKTAHLAYGLWIYVRVVNLLCQLFRTVFSLLLCCVYKTAFLCAMFKEPRVLWCVYRTTHLLCNVDRTVLLCGILQYRVPVPCYKTGFPGSCYRGVPYEMSLSYRNVFLYNTGCSLFGRTRTCGGRRLSRCSTRCPCPGADSSCLAATISLTTRQDIWPTSLFSPLLLFSPSFPGPKGFFGLVHFFTLYCHAFIGGKRAGSLKAHQQWIFSP